MFFFCLTFTCPHLYLKRKAPQNTHGFTTTTITETALTPHFLLHIAKQSRHYLPEVTPWTIFHCQKRNVINQKVHLLRNFTGSYYIGMVQPKHVENWMKTLQQIANKPYFMFQVQFLFSKYILAEKYALQLVPTSIQMQIHTLGVHKPVISRTNASSSWYRTLRMRMRAQGLDSHTFLVKSLHTCLCFCTWRQFPLAQWFRRNLLTLVQLY